MKMFFSKKLGILGLSFVMALSVFCGVLFATKVAVADTTLTENFVVATGATVTGNTVNGESGVGYQGEIPYLLTGNSAINFTLSSVAGETNYAFSDGGFANLMAVDFIYVVCDAEKDEVFRVVYKTDYQSTKVFVTCESSYVSSGANQEPNMGYYGYGGQIGVLEVKFDEEVVQVWTTTKDVGQVKVASFDGVELPNIYNRLSNGYIYTFETDNLLKGPAYDPGPMDVDVTFNSVTAGTATYVDPNAAPVVVETVLDANLAVATGATVTGNTVNGETGVGYSGRIPYLFTGDSAINFTFSDYGHGAGWVDQLRSSFIYTVSDINNTPVFYVAYTTDNYTGTTAYVIYNEEVRSVGGTAPDISRCGGAKTGVLKIKFDGEEVKVRVGSTGGAVVATFDGTDLPSIYNRLEDGYQISFATTNRLAGTYDGDPADIAADIDVTFNSVTIQGDTVYNVVVCGDTGVKVENNAETTLAAAPVLEEGKVFVGWKDTVGGGLYKAGETITVTTNRYFEAITFTFKTFGASLRVDTEDETSGLRFIINYNGTELEEFGDVVQEFGTVIVKTSSLAEKEFVLENFTIGTDIAKIVNTKDHFAMTEGMAYSAALINIKPAHISQAFSARGYMVVEYHDGSTETIYTAYSAENNSRSVQGVAQMIKAYLGGAYYNSLDADVQAIIDSYAG